MSSLSLPMVKLLSWSSLESVFLTRRAVRRAWGFWYQHSFKVFAMAAGIYENTAASVNQTRLSCVCRQKRSGKLYRVGMESVVQNRPLLVDTDHLPHLLKAGIYGHQVKEGRTILFNDSWDQRN